MLMRIIVSSIPEDSAAKKNNIALDHRLKASIGMCLAIGTTHGPAKLPCICIHVQTLRL